MATPGFVLKRLAAQRLLAVALIVTLGFTIGVLVAGPIYADASREAILTSEVLSSATTVKNARFRTDGSPDFPHQDADATLREALSGVPLDRVVRQGLATVRLVGREERTISLALLFRDGAGEHLPLKGRFPAAPDEVALHRSVARRLGVEIGDTVAVQSGEGSSTFTVTATYAPLDEPETNFWFGSQSPFPSGDSTNPSPAVVTPEGFLGLAGPLGLFPEYVWDAYIDLGARPFVEVELIPGALERATDRMQETPALARVTLTTGLRTMVELVRKRTANLRVPIYLVVFQIGAVALAVLAGVAQLALSRQSFELAVLKSRGFTRAKLLGAQAVQTAATAALAYPVGLGLGLVLARVATRASGPSPPGVTFPVALSGASLLVGLAGAAVGGIVLILTSIPYVSRTVVEERRLISREERPLIARYPWEIFVGILGGAAFYEVRTRGFLPVSQEGSLDPLVLLAPTLLLFAASFAVLRLLLLLFRWMDRTLGRTRSLPAYLAGRRLGRSPGTSFATSLLLLLAAGLLVVSTSYRGIVVQNHEDAAHQDVGSDWRVEVASPDQPVAAMGRVPDGATPVLRADPAIPVIGGPSPVALGIDPATYAEGGWWREDYAAVPLEELLDGLADPPTGVDLPEAARGLEVTVSSPPETRGMLLQARVERPDRTILTLDLGALDPGTVTYAAPLEGPATLLSILFVETPTAEAPAIVSLTVDRVEAVGAPVPLDLSAWEPIAWRNSEGTATPVGAGLSLSIDPGTSHVAGGIRPPEEPLPVVLSSGLAGALGDRFEVSVGGQVLAFRTVGTAVAFPTVIGEFVLVPERALLVRSERLPDATLTVNEVWAAGEADPRPALEDAGFDVGDARRASRLITLLSQLPQSLAVGMHFTAAAGGMGLVIVGVGVGLYFSQRRREFEFASLRAMGVDRGQVTSVLLAEQAVLVGFAVAGGFTLGLAVLRLMMPYVGKSLGAAFPGPVLVVDWRALGLFGAAILAATALGLVLALQALLRSSVTSVLRGEAE